VVIQTEKNALYDFSATVKNGEALIMQPLNAKRFQFKAKGNQRIILRWKKR